jgi:hypothetical protein
MTLDELQVQPTPIETSAIVVACNAVPAMGDVARRIVFQLEAQAANLAAAEGKLAAIRDLAKHCQNINECPHWDELYEILDSQPESNQ